MMSKEKLLKSLLSFNHFGTTVSVSRPLFALPKDLPWRYCTETTRISIANNYKSCNDEHLSFPIKHFNNKERISREEFVRRLTALRQSYIDNGGKLLSEDELDAKMDAMRRRYLSND